MGKKTATVKCIVRMLDHEEHAFVINREDTGDDLMRRVGMRLDVGPEIDYFVPFVSLSDAILPHWGSCRF